MGMAIRVGLAVAVALPGSAMAEDPDRPEGSSVNGRFSIEETNDKFALLNSADSQYTQGLKLRATWDPHWKDSLLDGALYKRLRAIPGVRRLTASLELGQDIFTPEDITPFREPDELEPGSLPLTLDQKEAEFDTWYARDFPRDRPYSAELYLEYKVNTYFSKRTLLGHLIGWPDDMGLVRWSLGLRGGYIGSKYAGQIQKGVHVLMRGLDGEAEPRDPQGWEFQQRLNGFRHIRQTEISAMFGANLSAEIEWDIVNAAWHRYAPNLRISATTGAELGMFRTLGGFGLTAELGRLGRNPLVCFPGGDRQEIPPACKATGGPEVGADHSTWALYVFASAYGRLIAFNRHLHNRMFSDDLVEADVRPRDADVTVGVVLRLHTFEFEFSQMLHVKETRERELGRFHEVGTFKVSALF
jgi:hypothetical protein